MAYRWRVARQPVPKASSMPAPVAGAKMAARSTLSMVTTGMVLAREVIRVRQQARC